jgi:hypothetical protein
MTTLARAGGRLRYEWLGQAFNQPAPVQLRVCVCACEIENARRSLGLGLGLEQPDAVLENVQGAMQ